MVAWWLRLWTPGPEVSGLSPTRVLCASARHIYSPKVLEIPKKRWLRLNVTEKLFTGTIKHKNNKQTNRFRSQLQLFYDFSTIYVKLYYHFCNKKGIAKVILTSFNTLFLNVLGSILHFEI